MSNLSQAATMVAPLPLLTTVVTLYGCGWPQIGAPNPIRATSDSGKDPFRGLIEPVLLGDPSFGPGKGGIPLTSGYPLGAFSPVGPTQISAQGAAALRPEILAEVSKGSPGSPKHKISNSQKEGRDPQKTHKPWRLDPQKTHMKHKSTRKVARIFPWGGCLLGSSRIRRFAPPPPERQGQWCNRRQRGATRARCHGTRRKSEHGARSQPQGGSFRNFQLSNVQLSPFSRMHNGRSLETSRRVPNIAPLLIVRCLRIQNPVCSPFSSSDLSVEWGDCRQLENVWKASHVDQSNSQGGCQALEPHLRVASGKSEANRLKSMAKLTMDQTSVGMKCVFFLGKS